MRILYYTVADQDVNTMSNSIKSDYMSDLLFHGMRSLFGVNVVDYPKKKHMYKSWLGNTSELWGRGFTYAKTLDDINLPRGWQPSDFDVIIYSVHHTIHQNPAKLYEMLSSINHPKKVVIDGHDLTSGYDFALNYTPHVFKREIVDDNSKFIPISFGIPKEKVVCNPGFKTQPIATIVPADHTHPNRKTHVFETESDYYNEYRKSYFGITVKKGGWDCERHYEILGNGCIPIFGDIENCPKNTLTHLPKELLKEIKNLPFLRLPNKVFDKNNIDLNHKYVDDHIDVETCSHIIKDLLGYTKQYLTTESIARYVLEKVV